jgi:ribulose 1,5-bisphosphate synthetase/thiazole synthase
MIYDYVIVGNNMNSLMLAYYLFKENNKVLIIKQYYLLKLNKYFHQ